jgi:hypothetical protein
MDAPQEEFYRKDKSDVMADIRGAMSRRADFDPSPGRYATDMDSFEVSAVLEALTIDGEVLV